jgi:hypothetical protein
MQPRRPPTIAGTHDFIEANLAGVIGRNRPVCPPLFAVEQFACPVVELKGVICVTPREMAPVDRAIQWLSGESRTCSSA